MAPNSLVLESSLGASASGNPVGNDPKLGDHFLVREKISLECLLVSDPSAFGTSRVAVPRERLMKMIQQSFGTSRQERLNAEPALSAHGDIKESPKAGQTHVLSGLFFFRKKRRKARRICPRQSEIDIRFPAIIEIEFDCLSLIGINPRIRSLYM
mgnify:CR=1 FL=1